VTKIASLSILLLLAACRAPVGQQQGAPDSNITVNSGAPATATEARTEGGLPGKAVEVPTARDASDPKSPEAARALVERYADLLKQGRFKDAHRLWSGDTLTDQQFAAKWQRYGKVDGATVDALGELQGAAGSIYAEVPIKLSGTTRQGQLFSLSGTITLRRVNDVPGSTEEQRRWHIVKTELQPVG